ncbi:MAG: hypothetical protein ACRDIY_22895, partial [Chloroflexota bacterium]
TYNCGGNPVTSYNLVGSSSKSISAGNYDTISVTGSGSLTLNPGIYCITGSMSLTGSGSLTGNNVMLYFTCGGSGGAPAACSPNQSGGKLSLTGSGSFDFTAPTSGTYQGLWVFYDRNNISPLSITGSGGAPYTGTIYAKSSDAKITGSGGTSQIDSLVVVNTCTLTGSGGIDLAYTKSDNYQKLGYPALSQ